MNFKERNIQKPHRVWVPRPDTKGGGGELSNLLPGGGLGNRPDMGGCRDLDPTGGLRIQNCVKEKYKIFV